MIIFQNSKIAMIIQNNPKYISTCDFPPNIPQAIPIPSPKPQHSVVSPKRVVGVGRSQVSLAMHIPMLCLCAFLAELLATVVLCPAEVGQRRDNPTTWDEPRVTISMGHDAEKL